MSPKKKSEYAVPKLKDFSAAALDKAAEKLLAALENEGEEVVTLFADPAISTPIKNTSFKDFRDRWMARKNGILTQVNEGWLKSASPAAKRDVGRKVNELRTRVEAKMSEVQERFVSFRR